MNITTYGNISIYNTEQGGDDWHRLRGQKMTASHAQSIGAGGKGLETYIASLAANIHATEGNNKELFSSVDMERGNRLEEGAALAYELTTGSKVDTVGFVTNLAYENSGCSPDGLVGDEGLVEIKSPANDTFAKLLYNQEIDSKYLWQMQMQMLICDRKWCDFVAFNPNFKKDIFIKRIERDPVMQTKLINGLAKGNEILKKYEQIFNS